MIIINEIKRLFDKDKDLERLNVTLRTNDGLRISKTFERDSVE